MTQPFNLLSQKGYSTIGRQPHHTSFGEICEWYETGDSDLPGSRKLASPRCLHIGPVANRGFTISQPLPHLQNNCKCFRRRYLSILTRARSGHRALRSARCARSGAWPNWISIMANQVRIEFNEPCITGPKPIENSVKHPPACWPCHIPADLQDVSLNPESGSCQT